MNWIRHNRRSALIAGITALVPLVLYLQALFGLLAVRHEYQTDIDRLEPGIARMKGLMAFEEQLRASASSVDERVAGLSYPVSADRATVSARLQKDVREILVEAGLSVTNSQVLPVREEETFDYIGLKVTVTGDLPGLDAALLELAAYRPALLVESLDVWPSRGNRRARKDGQESQEIGASMQLLSLRALQ